MTNVGKWADWYQGVEKPWPYGETTSYEIGAAWLADCALTEDWGCGAGWLRTLMPPERYRGIDGSTSSVCDEVASSTVAASRNPHATRPRAQLRLGDGSSTMPSRRSGSGWS